MNPEIERQLVEIYKKAFYNTHEDGGGYGFRYHHGVRVMLYCKRFIELYYFKNTKINKEALIIGALFHDIGKVRAINHDGEIIYGSDADKYHEKIGSEIVGDYISEYVKDEETLAHISQIIFESGEKAQTTIEAKLVKDADRFDNYGFITAWRHITGIQYHKNPENILRLKGFWVDKDFRGKALKYLEQFNYEPIKDLAHKRFEKLDYLIKEIYREAKGLILSTVVLIYSKIPILKSTKV